MDENLLLEPSADIEDVCEFYEKARKYWSHVQPTVNGMLGGLGHLDTIDIEGSTKFLRRLKLPKGRRALDCGAGIGRVTKNLLLPNYTCVDLVEQDPTFASKAREFCISGESHKFAKRFGRVFNVGLQQFVPERKKYDLIWSQWVLGHLTDVDLVAFFERIRMGLTPDGCFVMKDNVTATNKIRLDKKDSSVMRPLDLYQSFLKEAGFKIVSCLHDHRFPKGLYPVYMIACVSAIPATAELESA